MKWIISVVLITQLTACAGALGFVGNAIDSQDPCQYKGKRADYVLPSFCGASSGHVVQVSRGAYNGTYLVNVK